MDTYKHLRVNAEDLIVALEWHMEDASWVVDLESGELILPDDEADPDEDDSEEADWEDSDRYMVVSPMESYEGFEIMENFVAELPEGEACRALERALRLPKPFRSFKDTLLDFLDLRERWFRFHHERMLEYAQNWVDTHLPGANILI